MKQILNPKNYSHFKIIANFAFAFFIPVIFFALPFTTDSSWNATTEHIYSKLSTGVILASIWSSSATYLVHNIEFFNKSKFPKIKLNTQLFIFIIYIIISLSLFSSITVDNPLNITGIIVQLILYFAFLFSFGFYEKQKDDLNTLSEDVAEGNDAAEQQIDYSNEQLDEMLRN